MAESGLVTRPRLIVHIGLHKTGTTTIQHYLDGHSFHLHQVGVHYPSTGRHPMASKQHGVLARAFDPDNPFQGMFALAGPIDRDLVTAALRHEVELGGQSTIIVSSEEMSRFDDKGVAAFHQAFDDFDIQPVAFVRNFPDLLSAYYGTLIEYTDHTQDPALDILDLDIVPRFEAWASISSDGKIQVVDVDASPSGDSVQDFLHAAALDAGKLPPPNRMPRLNRSSSPAMTTLIRKFRHQGISNEHLLGLAGQFRELEMQEPQTNLPAALFAELQATYTEVFHALRAAPFVSWHGTSGTAPARAEPPMQIADVAAAVFALGRAFASR